MYLFFLIIFNKLKRYLRHLQLRAFENKKKKNIIKDKNFSQVCRLISMTVCLSIFNKNNYNKFINNPFNLEHT